MNPQSQAFSPFTTSNDNIWRFQSEVNKLYQIQAEHAERLTRLERRQDEDARVKSVWGSGSPFPSILGGTPQQAPLSTDHFRGFDDDTNNLISSLHLDAEDEPRRVMGISSRANSVRFDESANQNHFSHVPRPSFDYLSRNNSSLGLAMNERSNSHKSDGHGSSAHSIRSATPAQANNLNIDTTCGLEQKSPQEIPLLAPGIAFLGSVPAVIRCWMNSNFKHDALLYAAVCTGSYKSYLSLSLITKLGFESLIAEDDNGHKTVALPVYFPEAVPHPASSRSNSPASQLPSLTAHFQVIEPPQSPSIQIILGSDTLRSHNADILFSSSSLTIFDDERSKLSIPLVRPEDAATFNTLRTLDDSASSTEPSVDIAPSVKYRPPIGLSTGSAASSDSVRPDSSEQETRPASRGSLAAHPLSITTRTSDHETAANSHRSVSGSPAVWSNWRKENPTSTSPQATLDWAATSQGREASYQRKDTGIKVLKPKSTRTASGPSRFFDEGRRRSNNEAEKSETLQPNNAMQHVKARPNPGSAFSWLNSTDAAK